MPDLVLTSINSLLDAERDAILAGDFETIAALTAQKELLLTQLGKTNLSPGMLIEVANAITRNQTLISAAMRGVRTATDALVGAQSIAAGTKIYQRDGKVSRMSQQPGDFSHRA